MSKEEKLLIASKYRLEQFWVTSCYHLEQNAFPKIEKSEDGKKVVKVAESNAEDAEIERYSDRFKQKVHGKREALESYMNFGARLQRVPKKLRWDRDSGDGKDFFAKLEEAEGKAKGKEDHFKKDEDEDEVEVEEQGEEESDDGDYNQNIDFDDDDDDFNIDEGPDEDFFGGED
ncbi:glutamic acid-rich protein-like [Asparagus officinalis]|uniref:glutamic acid-rich protein-like n=1 Tax=Asparagus officinalis TaxID=4686 RepID=UPI00098DE7FA|nr:glutamic acid-rich protein-like [Asparagus officinalis]